MALDLVTGFPGFIGHRLVRRMLDDEPELRVVALVEQRMLAAANGAAAEIDPERVKVLGGDISQRRLGLSDEDYAEVQAQVRRVYHLAAIYDLAVPLERAQRVNVDGTGNVLELCAGAQRLERLAYVSTAYVAGVRRGVVYEHELGMGQNFKNHYESTKFQAEVWVRQLMDRVPTTVVRPAIVVGDSTTGQTQKFDGPYYLLKLISLVAQTGQPLLHFGRARSPFNVVPVDYVVQAMVTAAAMPEAEGETLHLVDPQPLSSAQLLALLSEQYGGPAPKGRIPPLVVETALRLPPVQRQFGGTPREAIAYLNHPVEFDMRRCVDLLGGRGLVPPRFTDYVEPLVRFFRDHEHDPAFAARESPG